MEFEPRTGAAVSAPMSAIRIINIMEPSRSSLAKQGLPVAFWLASRIPNRAQPRPWHCSVDQAMGIFATLRCRSPGCRDDAGIMRPRVFESGQQRKRRYGLAPQHANRRLRLDRQPSRQSLLRCGRGASFAGFVRRGHQNSAAKIHGQDRDQDKPWIGQARAQAE